MDSKVKSQFPTIPPPPTCRYATWYSVQYRSTVRFTHRPILVQCSALLPTLHQSGGSVRRGCPYPAFLYRRSMYCIPAHYDMFVFFPSLFFAFVDHNAAHLHSHLDGITGPAWLPLLFPFSLPPLVRTLWASHLDALSFTYL